MRHRIPDGDLAALIDAAVIELLIKLEKRKCGGNDAAQTARGAGTAGTAGASNARSADRSSDRAAAAAAAAGSGLVRPRTIPLDLRRAVWRRYDGRCAFLASGGKRCSARAFLEFHHVDPFARGGRSTVMNLELRCRAHNAYEAERVGLGRRTAIAAAAADDDAAAAANATDG